MFVRGMMGAIVGALLDGGGDASLGAWIKKARRGRGAAPAGKVARSHLMKAGCRAREEGSEVPEFVELLVAEVPHQVVGRDRIEAEEFGKPVVGVVEAGLDVELVFGLENVLA